MRRPTQKELRTREVKLASEAGSTKEAIKQIAADRLARWIPYVDDLEWPEWLNLWVNDMTVIHGPQVRVWGMPLDWVTAFLVARYGQAEYNWPADAAGFTAADEHRAGTWLTGKKQSPEGVAYIHVRGG